MLRAIEEQDLGTMKEWRNSPFLRQYFREYRELTPYDQARWYEELVTNPDKAQMFAIWYDGVMVGCCGLTNIDWHNRSAEVSIYLGEPKVGGVPIYIDDKVAPLALKDLLKYAFDECGLHRLWAEVFEFDDKKQKLFADFKPEGAKLLSHFAKGKFWDVYCFGYLEEAWRSA